MVRCALQTHPNICLVGEEILRKRNTLSQLQRLLCNTVEERWCAGKQYGVILVPEGLIEFVPEVSALIGELNDLLASGYVGFCADVGGLLGGDFCHLGDVEASL